MKKSIFTISFIILALFFSFTYVFAANAGEQMINGMKETTEGAGNAVKDVTNGAIAKQVCEKMHWCFLAAFVIRFIEFNLT